MDILYGAFLYWWLPGILIVLIATAIAIYVEECEEITLEMLFYGCMFTLAGPLLLTGVFIFIKDWFEHNGKNVIIWESKASKSKKVLGLKDKK